LLHFLVRLACVKRAASVDSEPGSNSRLNRLKLTTTDCSAGPMGSTGLPVELQLLDHFGFELRLLTKLRHDISLRKRRCASST
jgi:hypothetical protein